MKTTIDLPENVLRRAKIVAAERRTTLKELVIEGLNQVTSLRQTQADAAERLIEALSKGRNTEPVGKLNREELHDREILRRH